MKESELRLKAEQAFGLLEMGMGGDKAGLMAMMDLEAPLRGINGVDQKAVDDIMGTLNEMVSANRRYRTLERVFHEKVNRAFPEVTTKIGT